MKTRARTLKRALRSHLRLLGFKRMEEGVLAPPDFSKDSFRRLHGAQRRERLQAEREFIVERWPLLRGYFANGSEVDPSRVAPRLELIQADTWQSDLFRMAALTWSVPVSQGYGRRMRFLVWDKSNSKLIGLIALADPVFNLGVRDKHIGWLPTTVGSAWPTSLTRTCWVPFRPTTCCWAANSLRRWWGRVKFATLLPGSTPACAA